MNESEPNAGTPEKASSLHEVDGPLAEPPRAEIAVEEELRLLSEAMPPVLCIFAVLSPPTRAWIIQRLADDDGKLRRAESEKAAHR